MSDSIKALVEYAQHFATCSIFRCVQCGSVAVDDEHYSGLADSHAFVALPCDCGLDETLAQLEALENKGGHG